MSWSHLSKRKAWAYLKGSMAFVCLFFSKWVILKKPHVSEEEGYVIYFFSVGLKMPACSFKPRPLGLATPREFFSPYKSSVSVWSWKPDRELYQPIDFGSDTWEAGEGNLLDQILQRSSARRCDVTISSFQTLKLSWVQTDLQRPA